MAKLSMSLNWTHDPVVPPLIAEEGTMGELKYTTVSLMSLRYMLPLSKGRFTILLTYRPETQTVPAWVQQMDAGLYLTEPS